LEKKNWKDLVGEKRLCDGGSLLAICFCCKKYVECPVFQDAINFLKISVKDWEKIKVKMSVKMSGYNLFFAPPLDVEDSGRDLAIKKLEWSISDFLKYKFRITEEVASIASENNNVSLNAMLNLMSKTKIVKDVVLGVLDVETGVGYYGLGLLYRDVLKILTLKAKEKVSEDLEEKLSGTEVVAFRIPKLLLRKIDRLVELGIYSSRTKVIIEALKTFLHLKHVERYTVEEKV